MRLVKTRKPTSRKFSQEKEKVVGVEKPAGEANSGKSNCADLLEIMACCCYLVAFHAGREKKDANYLCYTSLFALLAR
jgi:hypothetical protein